MPSSLRVSEGAGGSWHGLQVCCCLFAPSIGLVRATFPSIKPSTGTKSVEFGNTEEITSAKADKKGSSF